MIWRKMHVHVLKPFIIKAFEANVWTVQVMRSELFFPHQPLSLVFPSSFFFVFFFLLLSLVQTRNLSWAEVPGLSASLCAACGCLLACRQPLKSAAQRALCYLFNPQNGDTTAECGSRSFLAVCAQEMANRDLIPFVDEFEGVAHKLDPSSTRLLIERGIFLDGPSRCRAYPV